MTRRTDTMVCNIKESTSLFKMVYCIRQCSSTAVSRNRSERLADCVKRRKTFFFTKSIITFEIILATVENQSFAVDIDRYFPVPQSTRPQHRRWCRGVCINSLFLKKTYILKTRTVSETHVICNITVFTYKNV